MKLEKKFDNKQKEMYDRLKRNHLDSLELIDDMNILNRSIELISLGNSERFLSRRVTIKVNVYGTSQDDGNIEVEITKARFKELMKFLDKMSKYRYQELTEEIIKNSEKCLVM